MNNSRTARLMDSSVGNFKMNLLPAFSSEGFRGLTLQITLMLHSSAAILLNLKWRMGVSLVSQRISQLLGIDLLKIINFYRKGQ